MRSFFFLVLLVTAPLSAKIVEVKHFEEIKEYLLPNSLVILDIDNTLITPVQELGTDHWFCFRKEWHMKQGKTAAEALERALAEWEAVQNITQVIPVEKSTPDIVRFIQRHYKVVGLTTRGLGLATRTICQLRDVGIDLGQSALTHIDVPFLNPRAILYRKGVLFTAGTHKGHALLKLLDRFEYRPKRVIFINDKAPNLREIEVACEGRSIPFIGLRYSYLDEKVKGFRADIAQVQFEQFKSILSDEEAKQLIER